MTVQESSIANAQDFTPPPLWGFRETSEYTGIPVGTLKHLRHAGAGPRSFKLGGKAVRYDPRDVIAWVEAQREQGVGDAA